MKEEKAKSHSIYRMGPYFSPKKIRKKAQEWGVLNCYESSKIRAEVRAMATASYALGVEAVPSLIVNGRLFSGVYSPKILFFILDDLLKKSFF